VTQNNRVFTKPIGVTKTCCTLRTLCTLPQNLHIGYRNMVHFLHSLHLNKMLVHIQSIMNKYSQHLA